MIEIKNNIFFCSCQLNIHARMCLHVVIHRQNHTGTCKIYIQGLYGIRVIIQIGTFTLKYCYVSLRILEVYFNSEISKNTKY